MTAAWIKDRLRSLIGDWRLYRVFVLPVGDDRTVADPRVRPTRVADAADLSNSPTAKMRSAARHTAAGCEGLALVEDGAIAAVCHLSGPVGPWDGSIWPLGPDQLGVVDIVTDERMRGRGHAVTLLRQAARRHAPVPLFAYVWWNNGPSIRCFEKVGARPVGAMAEVFGRTVRLRWPARFTR